jgi:hypothetical protein
MLLVPVALLADNTYAVALLSDVGVPVIVPVAVFSVRPPGRLGLIVQEAILPPVLVGAA